MKKSFLSKKNITILYAEDEDLIRNEISSILNLLTDNVIVASDGKDGLEKFKNNKIDLIITDVNMPYMTGFEMLKEIREINPEVPAIILSAFSSSEFINEASKIDIINEYLLKPIDIKVLIDKINKNVEKIEKKEEFKKLRKLLEQYKIAVDSSSIVSKSDLRGNITYINKKFIEISGYEENELLGRPHSVVRHPDMPKDFFKNMWEIIRDKKEIFKGKIKNKAKDGSAYFVDATILPILDLDGNVEEYIGLRTDITELEAYKEVLKSELQTSQTDLKSKVHLINEYEKTLDLTTILIRIDLGGNITFANEHFLDICSNSLEELKNIKFKDIIIKDDMSLDSFYENISSSDIYNVNLKHLSKNNEEIIIEYSFRKIVDINGNIIEYMGIGKDITEVIKLHKEVEDTQIDVIFALGTIGEARSKETGNHVKRVAKYSRLIAEKLGLSKDDCNLVEIASPMHDIGKVGIPDAILNKPARFTPEEFEIMKTHATIGYNMLNTSNRKILKASAIIAYHHHEKYDGSGYPQGLSGEDIDIFGRITAVADVFDALGSDRCYKKAWELDKILQLFKDERGKHFDPKIVDILFDNLGDFLAIRDKYKDIF